MIDIKNVIQTIQERKVVDKTCPAIVSMLEIQQEVSKLVLEELRHLMKIKSVKYYETLNGHSFSIEL